MRWANPPFTVPLEFLRSLLNETLDFLHKVTDISMPQHLKETYSGNKIIFPHTFTLLPISSSFWSNCSPYGLCDLRNWDREGDAWSYQWIRQIRYCSFTCKNRKQIRLMPINIDHNKETRCKCQNLLPHLPSKRWCALIMV